MRTLLSLLLVALIINSCSTSNDSTYEIPNDVVLYDNNLISPFFIEQLTEDPLKEIPAWNDSLIQLLQINQIRIKSTGIENQDQIGEEFQFNFRRQGIIYSYIHTNNNVKPALVTEIGYKSNGALQSGACTKLYNKRSNQQFVMLNRKDGVDYVRHRSKTKSDTLRIFGTLQKPQLVLFKSASYILSVNFFINENMPLESINELCSQFGIDLEDIKNSELSVTYLNKKHLPKECYHINDQWKQTELLASWEYLDKKLHSYSKFVNGNMVKNFSFSYDQNKMLKSFVYNQLTYEIQYN